MRYPMLKKLLWLSLVVIICLTAVYQLRVQLIRSTANQFMRDSDIQLLHLSGLQIAWNRLHIQQLVAAIGPDAAQQTLSGVELNYRFSLSDLSTELLDLTLQEAILTIPATEQRPTTEPPPRLQDLLALLNALPLQSVTIAQLSVQGLTAATAKQLPTAALAWRQTQRQQSLRLNIADTALQIGLDLTDDSLLMSTMTLKQAQQEVINLKLTLAKKDPGYQLQGSGSIDLQQIDRLISGTLGPHISPYLPPGGFPPSPINVVQGELKLLFKGLLDSNLEQLLQHGINLSLTPDSELQLDLATTGEQAIRADMQISWQSPITLALLANEGHTDDHTDNDATPPVLEINAGPLTVRLREHQYGLQVDGALSQAHCQIQGQLNCQLALALTLTAARLRTDSVLIEDLQLSLPITATLVDPLLTIAVAPSELLAAKLISFTDNSSNENTQLKMTAVNNPSPLTLSYQIDKGALSLSIQQLLINLPQVASAGLEIATQLQVADLKAQFQTLENPASFAGRFQLNAESINLRQASTDEIKLWLPALGLQSSIVFDQKNLGMDAQILSDQKKKLLTLNANHQLATASGVVQLSSGNIAFDEHDNTLSSLFSDWPFSADIQGGQLTLEGQLQWQSPEDELKLTGKLSQQLQQLTGYYQETVFAGLDFDLELDILSTEHIISRKPARLTVDSLDVGLPINNIDLDVGLDLSTKSINVLHFEAHLLGGTITADNALYTADIENEAIILKVNGLQIQQALSLAAYDAVEGTGTIDGELPLFLGSKGLKINNGQLAARAPGGVLRYQPSALSEAAEDANPAMILVTQALSNYHYDTLHALTQYRENGDLELALTVDGENPDMNDGQSIKLNLNLSDNVLTLLRSLRADRNITEAIEKALDTQR